jgi:amino acid transporter
MGYNPDLVDSLAQQRVDTWVGVILLLVAFFLQMWNTFWPVRIGDWSVHKIGAVSALVFSFTVGIGAFYLSKQVASNTADRVRTILNAQGAATGEGR